jgi:O-antigen/teichoic acid export membrane protein
MFATRRSASPAAQSVTSPAEPSARTGNGSGGGGRSLTGDAAVLVLGSMLAQGALVVNLSILARIVPKAQIATYQQLTLLYGIVAPLFLGGVPAALLYFIPRATDAETRTVWIVRAYIILTAMGLVAVGVTFSIRGVLSRAFNNPELDTALALYAPFLLCAFIAAVGPPALVACRRARAAAFLNAAVGACVLAGSTIAALISPTGTSLALGLTIAGIVLAVYSVTVVWRTVGLRGHDPHRYRGMRELLSYGLPLALSGLAGTLGFQIDRVVVGSSFPPATFAIYALGAVEIPIGLLIGQAVTTVLVPTMSIRWRDGDRVGMVTVWRAAMCKTSTILFPLFTFLLVMAADVVRTLYGSGYAASVPVFRIYLFLIPMRVATWGVIPQAVGRTRLILGASVVILISNATIAISLVHPLGIIGAALAGPISTLIAAGYFLVCARAITGFKIRKLVPVGELSGTMLVAVVCAIPLLLLRQIGGPSAPRLGIAAILFALLVVPAMRRTGRISDEDWSRGMRLIGRLTRRIAFVRAR